MSGEKRTWTGRAPAKVNLLLRVLAREEGGHHQIETIFQAVDLADEVTVAIGADLDGEDGVEPVSGVSGSGGGVARGGSGDPAAEVRLAVEGAAPGELGPDRDNLAVRAARLYLGALGRPSPPVRIRLVKHIPHGAGLGGGSSDAAAVLRGLDALHGWALGRHRLLELGSSLGADVPFFVLEAARALGWGRGDRLLPLEPLPPRPVLLALPPEPVSTPWAYRILAEARAKAGAGAAPGAALDPRALSGWDGQTALAENAFEPALRSRRPELARLKRALADAGADLALLSGSGSAVFGIFADEAPARAAESAVRDAVPGSRAVLTRTWGP